MRQRRIGMLQHAPVHPSCSDVHAGGGGDSPTARALHQSVSHTQSGSVPAQEIDRRNEKREILNINMPGPQGERHDSSVAPWISIDTASKQLNVTEVS